MCGDIVLNSQDSTFDVDCRDRLVASWQWFLLFSMYLGFSSHLWCKIESIRLELEIPYASWSYCNIQRCLRVSTPTRLFPVQEPQKASGRLWWLSRLSWLSFPGCEQCAFYSLFTIALLCLLQKETWLGVTDKDEFLHSSALTDYTSAVSTQSCGILLCHYTEISANG